MQNFGAQKSNEYNYCIYKMMFTLAKRCVKAITGDTVDDHKFAAYFGKLYGLLLKLEEEKQHQMKFSQSLQDLAQLLGISGKFKFFMRIIMKWYNYRNLNNQHNNLKTNTQREQNRLEIVFQYVRYPNLQINIKITEISQKVILDKIVESEIAKSFKKLKKIKRQILYRKIHFSNLKDLYKLNRINLKHQNRKKKNFLNNSKKVQVEIIMQNNNQKKMFTTKSQFYQASSTGRFQFRFKPSVELGGFPSLTPSNSDKRMTRLDWFNGPSDQLEKQKKHCLSKESKHHEDLSIGKRTFLQANRDSDALVSLEDLMQRKNRVPTFELKRNLIPVRSPGDKIYPYPEYEPEFFKQDDGLIPGANISTRHRHPFKISKKFHGL